MTSSGFDPDRLGPLRDTMSPDDFQHLVQLFAQDLGLRLTMLDDALRSDDRAGVQASAHAIRGLAGNMGADALARHAAELEAVAHDVGHEALAQGFALLLDAATRAQAGLEAMLEG